MYCQICTDQKMETSLSYPDTSRWVNMTSVKITNFFFNEELYCDDHYCKYIQEKEANHLYGKPSNSGILKSNDTLLD